jgi:hypothetical protein
VARAPNRPTNSHESGRTRSLELPDGSTQLTQTWLDTDGEHVIINTVQGFQKDTNVQRDPRVAINVSDAENPSRYYEIRENVVDATTEGGAEHIEALAQRCRPS